MTQEEKQLLIKVLCAGLPYGTKVEVCIKDKDIKSIDCVKYNTVGTYIGLLDEEKFSVKPYLRRMSSMTEEEHNDWFQYYQNAETEELNKSGDYFKAAMSGDNAKYDWLNSHHFDYRGLIPMGIAIEAPEGMYNNQ